MGWVTPDNKKVLRIAKPGSYYISTPGVFLPHARLTKFGMGVGSSDLAGGTRIKITEDMVGMDLPVLTFVETKSQTGKASQEQKNFIEFFSSWNAIAIVARCAEDVYEAIKNYKPK